MTGTLTLPSRSTHFDAVLEEIEHMHPDPETKTLTERIQYMFWDAQRKSTEKHAALERRCLSEDYRLGLVRRIRRRSDSVGRRIRRAASTLMGSDRDKLEIDTLNHDLERAYARIGLLLIKSEQQNMEVERLRQVVAFQHEELFGADISQGVEESKASAEASDDLLKEIEALREENLQLRIEKLSDPSPSDHSPEISQLLEVEHLTQQLENYERLLQESESAKREEELALSQEYEAYITDLEEENASLKETAKVLRGEIAALKLKIQHLNREYRLLDEGFKEEISSHEQLEKRFKKFKEHIQTKLKAHEELKADMEYLDASSVSVIDHDALKSKLKTLQERLQLIKTSAEEEKVHMQAEINDLEDYIAWQKSKIALLHRELARKH